MGLVNYFSHLMYQLSTSTRCKFHIWTVVGLTHLIFTTINRMLGKTLVHYLAYNTDIDQTLYNDAISANLLPVLTFRSSPMQFKIVI